MLCADILPDHDTVAVNGAQAKLAHAPRFRPERFRHVGTLRYDCRVVVVYIVDDQ
jgi:hypothetical protein